MRLADRDAARILDVSEPDDSVDAIQAIKARDPDRSQRILVEMDRQADIHSLFAHLPDTAGGIMTTGYVRVAPQDSVEEALRRLRQTPRGGGFRSYLYVTETDDELVGVIPVDDLVLVDSDVPVEDIMAREPVVVHATDDQQQVAHVFGEKH